MDTVPLAKLEFHLLGAPQIRRTGILSTAQTAAKAQALLYYLAMTAASGRTTHTRTALAPFLWGECGEAEARGNLRKVIQQLREQFAAYLVIDHQTVGLRTTPLYTVDAVAFASAIATPRAIPLAQLQQAILLYQGDFLEGFYVREAPDFETWMLGERARLRELMVQGVETLALRYADEGNLPHAITTARRLLVLEPWREETHQQLMNWLAESGQRSAALAQYEICGRALRDELGVEPSAATRTLYERLRQQSETGPTTGPTTVRAPSGTISYTLVGRQQEWQTLRTAWRAVPQNGMHFVCIAGEVGIGKSRLAEELVNDVQHEHQATARTRCYAVEGRLAYGPVADWLRSPALRPRLTKLNKVWLGEIVRLVPELLVEQPELSPPQPLSERWQQKQFFDALVQAFIFDQRPLLLILDDLQWCDPETLDWLHYLLSAAPQASILLVGTMRNDEMDDDHPLYKLGRHLRREGKLTMIELPPLSADETAFLGTQVAAQQLDANATQWLYQETAGNPLFVVECVRAGLPQADRPPKRPESRTALFGGAELPANVVGVIQARLAQLSREAHDLAQLAAAVGRTFTVALLAQAGQQDEETAVRSVDELWRRRLVREQEPDTYDFTHDRLRDVAYAEVSPVRRRLFHQRIAQALEEVYGADLDPISGQVAIQYELAGHPEQAVPYYVRAAATARQLYANHEVVHYLHKGLALLNELPRTPAHLQQELELQVNLGAVLMDTLGWASTAVEQAYARAFALSRQVEQTVQLFPILWGLHEVYLFQAKADQAHIMAERCMMLAQQAAEPDLLLQAHHAKWGVLYHLAADELPLALAHAEQGVALYNPQSHHDLSLHYGGHDPGVCSLVHAANLRWLLGYPEQAQAHGQAALRLGRQLNHPFSLALALNNVAMLYMFCREPDVVIELTITVIKLVTNYEMPLFLAEAMILHGWALTMQGKSAQGVVKLRQGMAAWQASGTVLERAHHLLLLAEAYTKTGEWAAGLVVIDEALTNAYANNEHIFAAEIHRLRGELLLIPRKSPAEAEAAFHQAIQVARQQQTKSLELRATMSLCRLWQQQGKVAEAGELLSAIYGWFTEGFDTADLREAKALLDELHRAETL